MFYTIKIYVVSYISKLLIFSLICICHICFYMQLDVTCGYIGLTSGSILRFSFPKGLEATMN